MGQKKSKSKGRRILCGGMCLTGPIKTQYGAYAILLLITCATAAVSFFTYQELFVQNELSIALSVLFSLATFLGLWTMIVHTCVMCSDPGVLTHRSPQYSVEYTRQCLDLDEEEQSVFDTDPVYKSSLYY